MASFSTVFIPVVRGTPQIPDGHSCLDVSNAAEREVVNVARFYQNKFRVAPELNIFYSANEMAIQFARDCAADQTLQFVYTFENGGWLFISTTNVLLKFVHQKDTEFASNRQRFLGSHL